MSSGSYIPPPVRAVEIPKKSGGSRMLGVPTLADRVAQTVAYLYLEPEVEPVFTNLRWVLLYVERWLKAPLQLEDGTLEQRDRGSPQGSAISPVLANIFLHYALDMWLGREFPGIPFERYADDGILHCKSETQAQVVRDAIIERLAQVGLELNLDKLTRCTRSPPVRLLASAGRLADYARRAAA
jgi:RNA-directed DNA polymerase